MSRDDSVTKFFSRKKNFKLVFLFLSTGDDDDDDGDDDDGDGDDQPVDDLSKLSAFNSV